MRKNLSRIMVLVAAAVLFNLGATAAFAEDATVTAVFDPTPISVGALLDAAGQPNNTGIVSTGPTDVLEIIEVAINPADLVGLIPSDQGPTLAVDIVDEGLGVAPPSLNPNDMAVFDPTPAGETDPAPADETDPAEQQDPPAPEAAPEEDAADDQSEDEATAELPQATSTQDGLLLGNAGSDPEGVLLVLAVAGIFVTIALMAVAVGGKGARS